MQLYLKIYLGLSVSVISFVGFLNWLVDPLWYGNGNRISPKNFAFDERVTKTNQFLQTKGRVDYDCLILGSSTATLLRSSSFEQQTCFNYAFSAGRIEEFIDYAGYVKQSDVEPSTVYVGVDPGNFSFLVTEFEGTTHIENRPIYQAYLSWDALVLSLRTLFQESPYPRYYNSRQNFEADIIENLPEYNPEFTNPELTQGCKTEKVMYYDELQQVFPNATFVGFVPPYSGWVVTNNIYTPGWLDCYLESIHKVADGFDVFYDFSIPSDTTTRTDNTYDGIHYYPQVYDDVADVMQQKTEDFGFDVKNSQLADYQSAYRNAIAEFLVQEGQDERLASDFGQ